MNKSSNKNKNNPIDFDKAQNVSVALSVKSLVELGGDASAEFIKGYTGVDNTTGQLFNRSLKKIAEGKINPDYATQNIKQQAGFSAEVLATSRDNAKAILNGSNVRTSRSEDIAQFGKNHNVVDRIKLQNGKIIVGTETQMKFVGKPNDLLDKIVTGKTEKDFSRYQDVILELPTEQVEGAKKYCSDKALELRKQANAVEKNGNKQLAKEFRENAKKYEKLQTKCQDSGVTTEDATFARTDPKTTTAKEIIKTSHAVATDAAKVGAVIGGSISLMTNMFSLAQGKKDLQTVAIDVTLDTAKSGALAYGTVAAGSALKSVMQTSKNSIVSAASKTSLPTLAVTVCLSAASSIKRFVSGDIEAEVLAEELGEQAVGMLSSSMMAALGQIAIPIPFVGAAIGGMVGYTVSTLFYQTALDASRQVGISRANYHRVQALCEAAHLEVLKQQQKLNEFMETEFAEFEIETKQLFKIIDNHNADPNTFASAINHYAQLLGAQLEFKSMAEFENFMLTDKPLIL
jgi:hypothetical protein